MTQPIEPHRASSDPLDPARAVALHATLDLPGAAPQDGDPLPHFWHYLYFWDIARAADLGRDGHPKTGDFIPDTGLPRRMWAGGALEFLAPLRLGAPAQKISRIDNLEHKTGRTGPLAIVTLTHRLEQNGRVCLKERQDLIYREDPSPDAPAATPTPAPMDETHRQQVQFTPVLLFRYSALTFNGHRIHYDREYCQNVEGYPGLVVHGPLLAQLLIRFAAQLRPSLPRFEFRAIAPLFDFETAEICARHDGDDLVLWVRGPDGRLCMTARA